MCGDLEKELQNTIFYAYMIGYASLAVGLLGLAFLGLWLFNI